MLEAPVLAAFLKAMTGRTAGEKLSECTGLLGLVIFFREISWGCIIFRRTNGFPLTISPAANQRVRVPRTPQLDSIVFWPGCNVGLKSSGCSLKERETEQPLPIKTHSCSTSLLEKNMWRSSTATLQQINVHIMRQAISYLPPMMPLINVLTKVLKSPSLISNSSTCMKMKLSIKKGFQTV